MGARALRSGFVLSVWTRRENDYVGAQLDMRSQTFRSREFMSLFLVTVLIPFSFSLSLS